MDEVRTKALLADRGLAVPVSVTAESDADLEAAAEKTGFPLVLKSLGSELSHKSELGGVALGIENRDELFERARTMREITGALMVEEMIGDVIAEVLVGVSHDPQFGHYLVIGLGGTAVELFKDSEILLFPFSRDDVVEALKRLKSWPLLDGYRGRPKADVLAVADFAIGLSDLIQDRGKDIVELEVNPLMVRKQGQGVVAADAVLRLVN